MITKPTVYSERHTRRQVIRRSGTILAVGGFAAMAGCGERSEPSSTDNPGRTASPPPTVTTGKPTPGTASTRSTPTERWTGPAYAEWLPAPETVIPASNYQFGVTDLATFATHRDTLPPPLKQTIKNWHPVELDWRTVPMMLGLHGNQVIQTDYDREAIIKHVVDTTGWTDPKAYAGYAILQNDNEGKTIAVGQDTILITSEYPDVQTAAETAHGIIDTKRGQNARYPAKNDAVDAVIDEINGGTINQWLPTAVFDNTPQEEPMFDGQVGIGKWAKFRDVGTEVKYIIVYEAADIVDLEQVRMFVNEHTDDGEQFAQFQDIAIRQNGQLAIVEGTMNRNRG